MSHKSRSCFGFIACTFAIWTIVNFILVISWLHNSLQLLGAILFVPLGALSLFRTFLHGIVKYPLIILPSIIFASGVTYFILRRFKLLKFNARSALVGNAAFFFALLIGFQIVLFSLFQIKAMTFNAEPYCLKQKAAHQIILGGANARMPHAALYTQDARYLWSFKEMAFIPMSDDIMVVSHQKACRSKRSEP